VSKIIPFPVSESSRSRLIVRSDVGYLLLFGRIDLSIRHLEEISRIAKKDRTPNTDFRRDQRGNKT